jgi:hypothetical protein
MRKRRSWGSSQAANYLSLAAMPTFMLMALLNGLSGAGHSSLVGTQLGSPSLLSSMTTMYLLMALVHLKDWFRRANEMARQRAAGSSKSM